MNEYEMNAEKKCNADKQNMKEEKEKEKEKEKDSE